jgi:PAS domain S-box-containing protein
MTQSLSSAASAVPASGEGGPLCILLIEDSRAESRLVETTLEAQGGSYVFEHADYLAPALARLQQGGVDVILADLTLPDSSGLETVKTLLERAPDVPLVVLSGVADESLAARAVRAGAQDYLFKGEVSAPLLARSLRYAVERKRTEAELEAGRQRLQSMVDDARMGEVALRSSEERYRRFFEEDLTGDCIATPEGRIVTCNQAFADIFGFASIGEALGSQLSDLFPDEETRRDFLCDLARDGKLERIEGVGHRRSGEPVYLIANVVGTFDSAGELLEFRAYVFDDTERRQAEEQLRQAQKMEAVGRLAGGIAHDFNNLVTAINGYSDLLLARLGEHAPERRELEEIRRAGDRAASLTRQLLAFSRSQMLRPTVLDLNEVVTGTEHMLRRVLGEDVRLVTRLAGAPGLVKADRGQIEQVLLNLVVNSRDAMPRGGELVLETAAVELDGGFRQQTVAIQPGPYIMLAVTDTGEGMAAEVLDRVFEPFFTTKDPGRGTGLGLSTAYGIVKQSGGYIFGYSEPGEGTSFKVYLPLVPAVREPQEVVEPQRNGQARGETILVVEDEEPVRRLIGQILESRGYAVLQAASGREALSVCRSDRRIDLVISDVVMPDMRGPDLGKILADLRPDTRVLYMSGYPGQAIAHRGELPDGTPFLEKPFTQDVLTRTVRDLLD